MSIWFQALWSIALVFLLQTFRDLTEYVVFAGLLFYALAVGARSSASAVSHSTGRWPST